MGQDALILGGPGKLRFVLNWRDDYESAGPVSRTWADLQVWVEDTLVWGHLRTTGQTEGITWSWIELLEFLATAWPYLQEEEQYPITFDSVLDEPAHLGELRGKAKLRWRNLPEAQAEEEDAILRDFTAVHDLAEALQGAYPPSLLLLRQGNTMLAATARQEWTLPFDETMATLAALGEAILDRAAQLDDPRSRIAKDRWNARGGTLPLMRLAIATSLDEATLREVWPIRLDVTPADDAVYELKATARMIGRQLKPQQLKAILDHIHHTPKGVPLDMTPLWEEAEKILQDYAGERPASQGYAVALMLRRRLGMDTEKIDPEQVLKNWSVTIQAIGIEDDTIDAVAIWSHNHRTTIFINPNGPRARYPTGKRITLAHEVCHLLIDIRGALPAAEALGGRVSRRVEQRANAFAAGAHPSARSGPRLRHRSAQVHL